VIARPLVLLASGTVSAISAFALASCSVQNPDIGIAAPPYSRASFGPVADYLSNRCGTLDCHGQLTRNFRVYGCIGLRASPDASPASCASPTSDQEDGDTYRSLVALEPQVMTAVYGGCSTAAAGSGPVYPPPAGCHPELLTFIRKAIGLEAHKGGQLICVTPPCPDGLPPPAPLVDGGSPVDTQYACLVTWLEGATDTHACGAAFGIPSFPLLDAGAPP
jgi:hypothetical protein